MLTSSHNNIAQLLWSQLASRPEATAFMDPATGAQLGRAEARADIARAVAALKEASLEDGAKVLVFSGRGVAFWLELVAVWAVGGVVIPLEDTIAPDKLAHIVTLTAPVATLGTWRHAEAHPDMLPPPLDLSAPASEPADRFALEGFAAPKRGDDLAGLMFTSGTTGDPKGVEVRHEMLSLNALGTQSVLRLRPSDRLGMAIPFRFISAISHFLVTLLAGATFVPTEQKMLAKDLVAFIEDHALTCFGGAPIQLRLISQAPAEAMPTLRWVMSSGDHLPPATIEALLAQRPDLAINCVYGLTEVAGRFCIQSSDLLQDNIGSVGSAIAGLELTVRDDDGTELGSNMAGHVYATGPCCFKGYFKNPEATAKALDAYGFKTGDIGMMDAQGQLRLMGRSDSVFKRAGLKVSCLPITEAIMETGFFTDAVVMPQEHEMFGAVPVAYVVAKADGFHKPDVLRLLRQSLPSDHLPMEFVTLPQIPRTGSGKVQRKELTELIDQAKAAQG